MEILPFGREHAEAVAVLLAESFDGINAAAGWDEVSAKEETERFLKEPERQAWVTLDEETGKVIGFIGAIVYSQTMWELHPLVVCGNVRRRGIGSDLVAHLEAQARDAGVGMIWLGSDDDFGGTNIYGVDLYPDPLSKLRELQALRFHPYQFYERCGYTVTGVLPDADGPGKHDILMAKRLKPDVSAVDSRLSPLPLS